jgi:hypothetical protein
VGLGGLRAVSASRTNLRVFTGRELATRTCLVAATGATLVAGLMLRGAYPRGLSAWADLSTALALPTAIVGLVAVWRQLRLQTSVRRDELESRRLEFLPYVRVDLVPSSLGLASDIRLAQPYFIDSGQVLELIDGTLSDRRTISAYFRNYQPHPLGMAAIPRATFLVEFVSEDGTDDFEYVDVQLPYLETGKPVLVNVCSFPVPWLVTVTCIGVRYVDLLGNVLSRTIDTGPGEVWHGRHLCRWDGRSFISQPRANL